MKPFASSPEQLPDAGDWSPERHGQLMTVFLSAMQGELARGRPLKYWENLKLQPKHLQMILMRASGLKNDFIANQMQMTPARVSVIVNHPDAQQLLALLVSYAAEDLLDLQTRIKAHAGEALDTVLFVMRNTRDDRVKSDNGFKLLTMAGYGAVTQHKVEHTLTMPSKDAQNLHRAIEEARAVEDVEYEEFIETPEQSGVIMQDPDSIEPPSSTEIHEHQLRGHPQLRAG